MNLHKIFSSDYWTNLVQRFSSGVISALGEILLIIILFVAFRFTVFKLIDRVLVPVVIREGPESEPGRAARIRTLQGLLKSVSSYVLGFVAGIMVLRALGVDPIPALTTASVAALAVGFGAQMLVRDVITGFFIILENQYAVGEYVTISGFTGTVEEIGMRITRIRDDEGKLIILANGTVSQITNYSRGSLTAALDVSIPAGADIKKAETLLNEIGDSIAKHRSDVLTPFKCNGIVSMDAGKITLRMTGRVADRKQEEVVMKLRSEIRERLIKEGIGII